MRRPYPIYTNWKKEEQEWEYSSASVFPSHFIHLASNIEIIFDSGLYVKFMLLGPPLAPITGGILATYASWRFMQLFLGVFGFLLFIIVFCFLPETVHPGAKGTDLDSVRKSFSTTSGKTLRY